MSEGAFDKDSGLGMMMVWIMLIFYNLDWWFLMFAEEDHMEGWGWGKS